MALVLPNSVFLHIPRTGGTTVRAALQHSGLAVAEMLCKGHRTPSEHRSGACCWHANPDRFACDACRDKFLFTFVRHPLTWYQSYWSLRTYRDDWKPFNPFDALFQAETFSGFLRNVLKHRPGYISGVFREFCLSQSRTPDFIGRYEQLENDLCKALQLAGEHVDTKTLHPLPSYNPGAAIHSMAERCLYTEELHEAVCETERDALEQFGYSADDVPCYSTAEVAAADERVLIHAFS